MGLNIITRVKSRIVSRKAINVVLLIGVLIVMFLLLELLTRAVVSRMDEESAYVDLHLLRRYEPAVDGSQLRYSVPLSRNKTHFQEATEDQADWYPLNKDNSILRVIGVGDSHIGGERGVFSLDCYEERAIHPKRECPIFGIGGFNIEDKGNFIQELVLPLQPDVIVLQLLDDDCQFNRLVWEWFPSDSSLSGTKALLNHVSKGLYRRSYLYRYLILSYQVRRPKQAYPMQDLDRCADSLEGVILVVRESRTHLVVIMSHNVKYGFEEYPRDELEKRFTQWYDEKNLELNLSTVYVIDALRNFSYEKIKGDDFGHMNQEGGAQAQTALYQALRDRGIITDIDASQ